MSILKCLTETLWREADEELNLDIPASKEDVTDEEPAPEEPADEESTGDEDGTENAKGLVDALIKYAPGKSKEIKNMLKYAANSGTEYDIFDSAYDYFESIEDTLGGDEKKAPVDNAEGDLGVDDEEPAPKPAPKPAPSKDSSLDLRGL